MPQADAVDVTAFGATPNDTTDDTAAFVTAIDALHRGGYHRLVIPTGAYRLSENGNPRRTHSLLTFRNIEGLRIESPCAGLFVTGTTGLFAFDHCRNVTVSGITVDWPRPPFSAGIVGVSTSNSFDIAVESEFPVVGGEPIVAFTDYDLSSRLPCGRDFDVYDAVVRTELLAPQLLRVHLSRPIKMFAGTLLVLRHQVYGCNAFDFHHCANVQILNSLVHTAPGMGVYARDCENVTLRRFEIYPMPCARRLMSTTADAAHFSGCTGTITLEECRFEKMGDNGVNVNSGLYLSVQQRVDEKTVIGQHNLMMIDLPSSGDAVELIRADTLLPFATNRVLSASLEPGASHLHRITFESALPSDLRIGDLLGNATRTPALRMRHCKVSDNRACGVLCQTRNAVIESCTFVGCTSAGVMVLAETAHSSESIGTRDVTVCHNTFGGCNHGAASAEAALCAVAYLKDSTYPPLPGVHRNIRFEHNSIAGSDESAIFAVCVDGLTLRRNAITGACAQGTRPDGTCAIRVMRCARANVGDNDVDRRHQGDHFTTSSLITP